MTLPFQGILQPEQLKNIPYRLAEHAFLFFLAFTLVALVFSALLFYFFVWIPQESDAPPPQNVVRFQRAQFEQLMTVQEQRRQRFEQADQGSFPNLFQPLSPPEQEELPNE